MAKVMFAGKWPLCTAPEVYKLWKEATLRALPIYGFCEDCLPEYQSRMIRERRCEHPETIFEEDDDGFVCGKIKKGDK